VVEAWDGLFARAFEDEYAGGAADCVPLCGARGVELQALGARDPPAEFKIEFVLTGDTPGSGKAQPVSFPAPADTEPVEQDGVKFIGSCAWWN
jgi:hypothetical protein